ncbi:MAG TPA: serine hydrolase domain-containing protein [Terracidiphilus sp.]|nr:serine hydrolase domain-containing protein [Terracidiphilus sp.]
MNPDGPASSAPYSAPCGRFTPAYTILREAIAARAFPGCAFGVLADGHVLVEDALGRFTYEDDAPSVTHSTAFDIASITKVFSTTAIAMLLHQQGRLDLEMPLGEILPTFVAGRDDAQRARHITLRHLMAHNSGLPGYAELFRIAATPEALLRACLALPIEAEPGARAEYSDIGFMLLGKAIDILAGAPLDALFAGMIAEPLQLHSARFLPPPSERPLIPPTEEDTTLRHRRIQGEVQDEHAWLMGGVAGHAGLFSNVPDLLHFAAEILRSASGSTGGQPALFAPNTIATFARRQSPAGSSRALGWDTPSPDSSAGSQFSARSIGHLGYSGCSLWIDLDAEIAVALLSNRTWPNRKCQLIRKVRPAFHDAIRTALAFGY